MNKNQTVIKTMGELNFIFGTVSSGKTAKLISQHYHYKNIDNCVCLLITPSIDTRNGLGVVKSRMINNTISSDIIVNNESNILDLIGEYKNTKWEDVEGLIIFVDEIQFFDLCHIDQLHKLSLKNKINCYGLKTNFKQELWPSSAKLLALATHIESVEVPCKYCSNIAHFNLKTSCQNIQGNTILLGSDEMFVQVCPNCYYKQMEKENKHYVTRCLEIGDNKKGFISLLEQLTDCPPLSFDQFKCQFKTRNTQNYKTIVIENTKTKKIIATATLLIEDKFIHECGKIGHLEDVVVDRKYRNMSFGKQLLTSITKIAKDIGCYKVVLYCTLENSSFYEKCGFVKKDYVHMSKYFTMK
jgi:glucosamine-phosphate N-acetyltransferase